MLKFFARLGGMRVEFIIHTNQSYLNYRYQRDISHDEYEVQATVRFRCHRLSVSTGHLLSGYGPDPSEPTDQF